MAAHCVLHVPQIYANKPCIDEESTKCTSKNMSRVVASLAGISVALIKLFLMMVAYLSALRPGGAGCLNTRVELAGKKLALDGGWYDPPHYRRKTHEPQEEHSEIEKG